MFTVGERCTGREGSEEGKQQSRDSRVTQKVIRQSKPEDCIASQKFNHVGLDVVCLVYEPNTHAIHDASYTYSPSLVTHIAWNIIAS